jgi:hypothetical protein
MCVPVCSFCGDQPVVRWYEGPDWVHAVGRSGDVRAQEAWLVCSTCDRLVADDDRQKLARRGAQTLRGVTDPEAYVARVLSNHVERFWKPRDVQLGRG